MPRTARTGEPAPVRRSRRTAVPAVPRLLVVLLAALLVSGTGQALAAPVPSGGVADPQVGPGGDTVVSLTLDGEDVLSSKPTDVVLMLDESGSIASADFRLMKDFVRNAITGLGDDGLFDAGGRIGIGMFSSSSRTILQLNSTEATVLNAANSIQQQGGYTCITCGVRQATAMFGSAAPDPDRNRIMVLLTDGLGNRETTTFQSVVDASRSAGVESFAIGVGPEPSQAELRVVASDPDPDHLFMATNFSGLAAMLEDLVAAVASPAATDVQVVVTVADAFVPGDGTVTAGAVSRAGQVLTWTIPELGDQTVTLSYPITHADGAPCGTQPVHASVAYSDAEGGVVTFDPLTVDVAGCPASLALAGPDPVDAGAGATAVLTATVLDDFGSPVADRPVDLEVVSGPNAGQAGSATTGPDGTASIEVTSGGVGGTDVVRATTPAADGGTLQSAPVEITWVDVTAPLLVMPSPLTLEASSPLGTPATWSASAHDETDGPVDVVCDPANGALFDLGTTSVDCTASDAAGNTAAGSFDVTVVDTAAPVITFSGAASPYGLGDQIAITCSATDAGTGVRTGECPGLTGPAYRFPGTTTLTATATDAAGNTSSLSLTIEVVATHAGLCDLSEEFSAKPGIAAALCATLDAAARDGAQADALRSFVNQLSAQAGKALTVDEAEVLRRLAQTL